MVLWQQIFMHFGADDFPLKFPFRKCFKIVVFRLGVEIRFSYWVYKLALCKSFFVKASLCESLLCVKLSLCKSFCVQKLAVCKRLLCDTACSV